MTRLNWGEVSPRYDLGVDRGVLYLGNSAVPWNGLVSVDEKESGAVNTDYYFEGNRLHVSQEVGDFQAMISAFTYPDVFAEYNGYSERNLYQRFGFSYRTQRGNDHRLHVVYSALISDDFRAWSTLSDRIDPSLFSWALTASAVPIPGASPTARLTMEVPRDSSVFSEIEDMLYGTELTDPRLPDPEELVELYESSTQLRIIQNGNGTYTAIGPDEMVTLLPDGVFEINAPSLFFTDNDTFVVSSY